MLFWVSVKEGGAGGGVLCPQRWQRHTQRDSSRPLRFWPRGLKQPNFVFQHLTNKKPSSCENFPTSIRSRSIIQNVVHPSKNFLFLWRLHTHDSPGFPGRAVPCCAAKVFRETNEIKSCTIYVQCNAPGTRLFDTKLRSKIQTMLRKHCSVHFILSVIRYLDPNKNFHFGLPVVHSRNGGLAF